MADNVVNYTSIADIKKFWYEVIAPNYFDFDNVNNYNAGLFGYVNEVMGNSVENAFNAITTARREFYPVSAEYMSSLYKMATLQGIDIPMTTPAHCKALFVLKQDEVIENSTYENGIYTCVIDSCLKIFADQLQFMLDYPVVILSKRTNTGWSHTIHYDVTIKNSLADGNPNRYIPNKVMSNGGTNYLVLFIDTIRQVELKKDSQVIIKDSILDTSSMEIDYDGNLANFEVFYIANQTSPRVQLQKVLVNGTIPNVPFCYYEHISNGKIRLTFPSGTSFIPEFNSEIEVNIYTSSGSEGNFERFDGDLICTSDSDEYPYNSNMTIVGQVNGSSTGGLDKELNEEFRTKVLRAYATNNTITTSNDLQLEFDRIADTLEDTRVLFRKKRDDAFIRLFGAYTLMKDHSNNVIPTNTVDLRFQKSDIMDVESHDLRVMIKPGQKFVYTNPNTSSGDYSCKIYDPLTDGQSPTYQFTNPFLIGLSLNPNTVGFYLNSLDEVATIEYTYVNDDTANQFIAANLSLQRNAMVGNNFYKFTLRMTPANSNLDVLTIGTPNPAFSKQDEESGEYTDTNCIRAKKAGTVLSEEYVYEAIPGSSDQETKYCWLKTTIEYSDKQKEVIISSNSLSTDDTVRTGYNVLFNPGESFVAGDIIATKLATDNRKLRVISDINGILMDQNKYIPWLVEDVDTENSAVTVVAYLSTDDYIDSNGQIEIENGIYDPDGTHNANLVLPMEDFIFNIYAFFKNDDYNPAHRFTQIPYLEGYTYANGYNSSDDTPLAFIESLKFIRSTVDFWDMDPPNKAEEKPAKIEVWNEHGVIDTTLQNLTEDEESGPHTYKLTVSGEDVVAKISDRITFPEVENNSDVFDVGIKFQDGIIDPEKKYHVLEENDSLLPFVGKIEGVTQKKDLHTIRSLICTGKELQTYKFLVGTTDCTITIKETEGPDLPESAIYTYVDGVFTSVGGNMKDVPVVIELGPDEDPNALEGIPEDSEYVIFFVQNGEVVKVQAPDDYKLQVNLYQEGEEIQAEDATTVADALASTMSIPGPTGEELEPGSYTDGTLVFTLNVIPNILFDTGKGNYYPPRITSEEDYGIYITKVPLVSYEWAADTDNFKLFIGRMKEIHAQLEDAYTSLENCFSIDMKFYNTYGKSQFYTVGLDDADTPLDNVSCAFRFGLKTSVLSNKEEFIQRVQNYIKDYVENFDELSGTSTQDIYILNLVHDVKSNFPEIQYMIYYGFNSYDHMAQKIVGPDLQEFLADYIPEFINVRLIKDSAGNTYPDISLVLLNK